MKHLYPFGGLFHGHTVLPFHSKPFPEAFLYIPCRYMADIAVKERTPEMDTIFPNPISLAPMAQEIKVKAHPEREMIINFVS